MQANIFPWREFIGLFLLLAGYIIALGSVAVIDWHGFLGRKSNYWTEATTRTHKITKPLIWGGLLLLNLGFFLYYHLDGLKGSVLIEWLLIVIIMLNGLFLTFKVSPYLLKREKEGRSAELLPKMWQRRIAVSFTFSFLAWWTALFLLVWNLIMNGLK